MSKRKQVIGEKCLKGHLLTPENAYVHRGYVQCRKCGCGRQRKVREKLAIVRAEYRAKYG
jgi:hypothetical protein